MTTVPPAHRFRRMCRPLVALVASVVLTSTAQAQIGRPPVRPRSLTWVSASVGVMELSDVADGSSNSEWLFGNTVQYRLSVELPIENQSTIGISGAFARVPLRYEPLDPVNPGCSFACDADATVTQLMATFHAGGNALGFHQIIDISLGAIGYSGFRARTGGERLPPRQLDADLAGGIGYGFGYTLSPDMQVTLVQEGFLSVHQRTGLDNGANTIGRQFVLRLGTRFGF
jgi:hypothetical protein